MISPVTPDLVFRMSVVCFVQFAVFLVRGTYKFTVREFGLADAIALGKTTTVACGASAMALIALPGTVANLEATVLLLDFYFLLSLTIGTRFSFQLLTHLFQRHQEDGRKVLIYGADREGATVLQRILESTAYQLRPAGFLDDRPSVEGKKMNGYPILGGHWKLERFVRSIGVDEIVLASNNIKPEILRRIVAKAGALGISLRRFSIHLEDVRMEGGAEITDTTRARHGQDQAPIATFTQ